MSEQVNGWWIDSFYVYSFYTPEYQYSVIARAEKRD